MHLTIIHNDILCNKKPYDLDIRKVDVSKFPIIVVIWILIFAWCVGRCGSKNGHQKCMCSKVIGRPIKKHANYSKFETQHNLGDLCDHLMSTRICTLIVYKMFI